LEVIYGDTDSVFLENQPGKIERLLDAVEKDLELDIRVDKIFKRVLFTEAKKRYAGLLPDGRLEIVGLEVVRGDWAEIARNVQETVIRYVLEDNSPSRAVEYVRNTIANLRARKVPVRDLVIWKSLTKPIEEYQVRAPHVEAAKKLLKKGWDLTIGDKIGYVVMKGPGKLYEKVWPLAFVDPADVDVEYYERNQLLPACGRILELLGIKEADLLPIALS
jgi:DNA polymerase I